MGKKYSREYTVTYYDSDANGEMKLSSLANVAIYFSGMQSTELGRSDELLLKEGKAWIITKHEFTIHRMPKNEEKVIFITEARCYNKFFCTRDFVVTDTEGQPLVEFTTIFAIMDLKKRKLTTISEDFIAPFESEKNNKMARPMNVSFDSPTIEKKYIARYSDLDLNQHVNNTKYIDWLLDPLGYDFLKAHRLERLGMSYLKEILPEEELESLVEVSEDRTTHYIKVGNGLHMEAEMKWRERKDG